MRSITDDEGMAQAVRTALDAHDDPDGGGGSIARDTAKLTVSEDITFMDGVPVTRVDASPEDGFNYPYYY
jgi:hypothetical protein